MANGPSAYDLRQQRLRAERMARLGKLPGFNGVARGQGGINYVVQPGDSWESIAGMFGGDQRKAYWLANQAGFSPFDVLQAGTRIKVPNGINGNWKPYVNEDFFSGIKYNDLDKGWQVDGYRRPSNVSMEDRPWLPMDSQWMDNKFGSILGTPNYDASYWANPANVNYWYNVIETQTIPADSWLTSDVQKFIKDTYSYMEMRNGFAPNTDWGYLPSNDPNWSQLQDMPGPPEIVFDENGNVTNPLSPIPQIGYGAVTDWTDPSFDWSQLSNGQKQAIVNNPSFNMHDVSLPNQGFILSDPVYDQSWNKMSDIEKWWQQSMFSLFSNPDPNMAVLSDALKSAAIGAASGAIVGVPLFGVGAIPAAMWGALYGGGSALLAGFGSQLGTGRGWFGGEDPNADGVVTDSEQRWITAGQVSQKAMQVLQVPVKALTQVIGTGQYMLDHGADYDTVSEIFQQFKGYFISSGIDIANWASFDGGYKPDLSTFSKEDRHAYAVAKASEMQFVVKTIFGKEFKTVDVLGESEDQPIRPGYTFEDLVGRIEKGEDVNLVFEDFRREYGFSGTVNEFAIQSVIDPMNYLPEIAGKTRGKFQEHSSMKYAGEANHFRALAEAADVAGDIEGATRYYGMAEEAQGRSSVMKMHSEANRKAPTIFGERNPFGMKSEAGKLFGELAKTADSATIKTMTPRELKLAGLDANGKVIKLAPTPAQQSQSKFRQMWSSLWNLNPEAKGIINYRNAMNNLGIFMEWVKGDVNLTANMEKVLTAFAENDIETLRDMGATFLDNPEFNTVQDSVREFLPQLKELNANFELAKIPRERFMTMMAIFGGDPAFLLKSFVEGDPKAIFDSIVEKARLMDTPAAKEFVAKVDAGEITAQSVAKELGVFKDGRVALYPDEHKYLVKAYFGEHFGEWAKKTFGISNESGFDAVLRGMKGAQSLVLLDFSPSYLVNNFINNRVLMAMNGVFGFTTNGRMDGWFNEFGFTPEGAGEGFGAAQYDVGQATAEGGRVRSEGSLGVKENLPKDGTAVMREGTKNTGLAGRIADKISGLRKFGIFSKMSAGLEGSSGKQMYYAAMRSYYGRRWRAGEGFKKMPELLRNRLSERGFNPDLIERNIEGFVSSKELDGLVNGSTNRSVSVLVHSAAEALGVDAGEAATMLGQLGILDELKDGLAKATTDEDIRAVFRQAREKGEKSVAERWQNELLDKAKHAQQKTQSEGLAGAVDAFDGLEDMYFQTKVENDLSWDVTFERLAEEADNPDLRSVIIETTKSRATRRWQQAQDNYVATMGGIFAGINMTGPEVGRMLWIQGEKFRLYREFFAERDAAYAAFFHDTNEVRMTYAELERTWNDRWQRLVTGEIDPLMVEFDDLFVDAFGKRFGEEGGYLARSWRDDMRRVDAELLQMMTDHRSGLANVDFETRANRWKEFKPKYQAKWQERLRNRNIGSGMIYERSGLDNVEANVRAPEQVTEPNPTEQVNPVENVSSTPEKVNKRAEEVSAAVERGRAATLSRERHKTAIFEMANQYGIATANPDGTPRVEAVGEIMAIVQEYGGPNSPQWKRFDDVPLDVVERAFDSWHNSPVDAVGGIESPDSVMRRVLGEEGGSRWDNIDNMREDIRSRLNDVEKYGTGLPARDALRQQMVDIGIETDVIDATMALADAHAEVWGRGNGRDAGDWYEQKIAGIENGGVDPNGNRGMVERLKDGRSLITVFQGGDATTVLHELGHVFRLELEGDDLRTVERWAGVENGEWTETAEEKWAYGLEQYAATRKAPTPELTGVFERFSKWAKEVYDRMRGRLDAEIPEDVMAVYDRMFADDTVYEQRTVTTDMTDADQIGKLDPRSLSKEQHELIETAGLIKEIDDRMAVVDEAWQKAQDAINESEGIRPRSAGDGHYLGNGMLYEKAGGKFYELMGDGSRGAEVSTKELRARGAEQVVPIGDDFRLQVEYQQLTAQRAELLDAKKQLTAKIGERERLDKGRADDPKVLYQAAADGDASVAGADNSLSQLRKAKRVWKIYGVESPVFMDWFGDWLSPKRKQDFLEKSPLSFAGSDLIPLSEHQIIRDDAIREYSKYQGSSIKNRYDGKTITFERSGLTKTLHGVEGEQYLKWRIISKLPEIVREAVPLVSELGNAKHNNIDLLHRYGIHVTIDELPYIVQIAVREMAGDNRKGSFYEEIIISKDVINNSSISRSPASKGVTNGGDTFTISRWLSEVNDHSAVVDANGAPLLLSRVGGEDSLQFVYRQPGDTSEGFYLNARNMIDAAEVNGRDNPSLRAAGYDGIRTTDGFIVFDDTQIKSVNNRGTFSPTDPRKLYQDGGQMPLFPVGGYDQTSGFVPYGEVMDAGWNGEVSPLLDAMERAAMDPEVNQSFDGMDAETSQMLRGYLNDVRGDMAQVKHETVGWGNMMHDRALLNYNEQYGFDKLLNAVAPYQFFMTRSAANWFTRMWDRPAFLSFYARFKQLQNTYRNQYPERTRNKVWVPMGFLPAPQGGSENRKGMGDGVWLSYQNQLMPWTMLQQPLDKLIRDENTLMNNAAWVLRDWERSGMIGKGEADKVINAQSGPMWEQAIAQAKQDSGENGGLFDYFGTLMSPALYLTLPYYLAFNKQMGDSGFPAGSLPITRTGNALKTAFKGTKLEWAGDVAGMLAAPENWYRVSKGLSEFGEWGDFYIDRQLANMAAEGTHSTQEVQLAMMERKGAIYDEAVERVRFEVSMRTPGFAGVYGAANGAPLDQVVGSLIPSLFPGGLLPPAEMEYKGLKQEYNLAWDAYNKGNKDVISQFFEDHPEYQARLALRRDPEERLIQFLKSSIWDQYGALGPTEKKQVSAYLGKDFKDFLGAEPGVDFAPERLANWAQLLGAAVPQDLQMAAGSMPQIPQINPQQVAEADQFFIQRNEMFPNYYQLQSAYYRLAPSDRAGFMMRFPEYQRYLNWKQDWFDDHEDLIPILNGEAFKRVDMGTWSDSAKNAAMDYALTGDKLSVGAEKLLRFYWDQEGKPYDKFEVWLDSLVVPALLNGNQVIGQ